MASKWSWCASGLCLFWTRVLVRLIQFGSSLVAYIALQTVGITFHNTAGGQTVPVIVNSGALTFARIINFLAFVYAFIFLVCVEWLRLCITLQCQWGFGRFLQCGQLYLGVAMSFLAMLAFLAIVVLGRKDKDSEGHSRDRQVPQQGTNRENQASYVHQGSPRAGATPVPIVTAQPVD
ncbi:unnamed protein product [Hyaloperonospora brassicae]|uniref:MARVEL domain-containing protein n=1 Tax=Hyaloperonospora brassicae TaxID=162125 RepID=A0AAV0U2G4_HYABA|nr:unnamed protein product [Hyaloperonospora brassicae]